MISSGLHSVEVVELTQSGSLSNAATKRSPKWPRRAPTSRAPQLETISRPPLLRRKYLYTRFRSCRSRVSQQTLAVRRQKRQLTNCDELAAVRMEDYMRERVRAGVDLQYIIFLTADKTAGERHRGERKEENAVKSEVG